MDENTWRLAQLGMWLIGIQTAFISGMIVFMWNSMSNKFEKIDLRLQGIETRVAHLEGILSRQESCVIKNDSYMKKAE